MDYEDDSIWGEASRVRDVFKPSAIKQERKFDAEVTKILGKPVLVNDPRLIQLVVKYKKAKGSSPDVDKMDNFLYDPAFLTELRKTFA